MYKHIYIYLRITNKKKKVITEKTKDHRVLKVDIVPWTVRTDNDVDPKRAQIKCSQMTFLPI